MTRRGAFIRLLPALGMLLALPLLVGGPGCGDDGDPNSLSGSIGQTRDLDFDRVQVQQFRSSATAPPDELFVQYVSRSGAKPAKLDVKLAGLTLDSDTDLDLTGVVPGTTTPRAGFSWFGQGGDHQSVMRQGTLHLGHWGAAGEKVDGGFFLVFDDGSDEQGVAGRNLEGSFSAHLEDVILPAD